MPDPTNQYVGSPAWREEMERLIRKASERLEEAGYNEERDTAAQEAEAAVQVLGIAAQQPGPAGEAARKAMRALILEAAEVLRRGFATRQ